MKVHAAEPQVTNVPAPTNLLAQNQDMQDVSRQLIRAKLQDPKFRQDYATKIVDSTPGITDLAKESRAALIDELAGWLNPKSVYTYGNLASIISTDKSLQSSMNLIRSAKQQQKINEQDNSNTIKQQQSQQLSAIKQTEASGIFKRSVATRAKRQIKPFATPSGQLTKSIPYQSNPHSGSIDFYTYAQEWKPLLGGTYGPDQVEKSQNNGLDALYLSGDLKKQEYTTPKSEGGVLGMGAKTNNFYNMSFMYLTSNASSSDGGTFQVGYYQDNTLDRWENGHLQMSGYFPVNANIKLSLDLTQAQKNFTDGNYGAYIRVQVPSGVDTASFAKAINWEHTGGSDNFNINVLGIHIPLIDNFITQYGNFIHFPLTWYPQETSVSPDKDPRAFYIAMGGVPTDSITAENMGDRGTSGAGNNTAVDAIPYQTAQDTFIKALIGIASVGLGNISGQVGGYITFDMDRYTGNYSTAELQSLGYDPNKDADIYAGADDSPNKLLTRGTLPPNSSNIWSETYTPFFSDSMLAPDSLMSKTQSGKGGWQNSLINSNNLTLQAVPTNTLPTWSTYFSPIDSIHNTYTGSVIDQYTNSKNHNDESFNIKNQLDANGNYVSGEFQEIKNSSDPNYNYHYALDGDNYRQRKITTHYVQDGFFSDYAQKRFYRVIDFFHKTDISNKSDTTLDPLTARDPQTGTTADGQHFKEFMDSHFNKPIQVYYNGTSNSSDGSASGSEINAGPVNSNNIQVTQWVKPSTIAWADETKYPRPAQSSINRKIPLSGIIYSKDAWFAKMFYRVNGGAWKQFSPLTGDDTFTTPTVGKTTGPGPLGNEKFDPSDPNWHLNVSFDTPGTYTVDIKATDNFGVDSMIGTPDAQTDGNLSYTVKIGQGYNLNLDYLNTTSNTPIKYKDGSLVNVDPYFVDTATSADYTLSLNDFSLPKVLTKTQRQNLGVEYHFDYATLDDPNASKHYQIDDQIPFTNLDSDHTIYYHYSPIALAFAEVPTLFDFGTRILPKIGETPKYLPSQIKGHLAVKSTPSGDKTWNVQVNSENLLIDNVATDMPVAQALYYYRSPSDFSLLNDQTPTMIFAANETNLPQSSATDPNNALYVLDSDWKVSPSNKRADDLDALGFKNGFVLQPKNQKNGELKMKEKYSGTLTWTLTDSIE